MNYRIYRQGRLTVKQQELYDWLRTLDEVPSLKNIARHFNYESTDITYHSRLQSLVRKGLVIRQSRYRVKDPATE